MSPLLAGALSGGLAGTATSLLAIWLHRRVFCGPRNSRWCRKCWARAVVDLGRWDACLHCGDNAWAQSDEARGVPHHGRETGTTTRAPDDGTRAGMLPGRSHLNLVRPKDKKP